MNNKRFLNNQPRKCVFKVHRIKPLIAVDHTKNAVGKCKKVFDVLMVPDEIQESVEKRKKSETTRKIKSGSWSDEEHRRFLIAMQKYGNSWKKIQAYVETRSCIQIRSHCQKYYEALRLKAIDDAKKDESKKLFAVYRTFRNTTCTFSVMHKINYDIYKSNIELKETKSQFNDDDSKDSRCKESLINFAESFAPNEVYSLGSLRHEFNEEFEEQKSMDEDFSIQPNYQNFSPDFRFDDSMFLSDEIELEAKGKISWYYDDKEFL